MKMNLEQIKRSIFVVSKDDSYEGLFGEIISVEDDPENFETENDCALEITVNFIPTKNIKKTHDHLNETSVENVFMCEDELVYFFEGLENYGCDVFGKKFTLEEVINDYGNYKKDILNSYS